MLLRGIIAMTKDNNRITNLLTFFKNENTKINGRFKSI